VLIGCESTSRCMAMANAGTSCTFLSALITLQQRLLCVLGCRGLLSMPASHQHAVTLRASCSDGRAHAVVASIVQGSCLLQAA
jgi:hypothetical protein